MFSAHGPHPLRLPARLQDAPGVQQGHPEGDTGLPHAREWEGWGDLRAEQGRAITDGSSPPTHHRNQSFLGALAAPRLWSWRWFKPLPHPAPRLNELPCYRGHVSPWQEDHLLVPPGSGTTRSTGRPWSLWPEVLTPKARPPVAGPLALVLGSGRPHQGPDSFPHTWWSPTTYETHQKLRLHTTDGSAMYTLIFSSSTQSLPSWPTCRDSKSGNPLRLSHAHGCVCSRLQNVARTPGRPRC